ncbi:MAG: hypothetical protein Fur0022_14120 [Anaerolineales bacterium]
MNGSSAPSLRPAKQADTHKFWLWLTTPAAATEAALRYRARFLGTLLVLLTVFFLGVDVIHKLVIPTYTIPWYRYLFLGIAYILNQKGHYGVASTLGIASFPVVIFVSTVLGLNQNTLFHLYYATLGLMVGSMLLPIRGVLVFGLVQLGIMALFPVLAPELFPDFGSIFPPLLLNLIFLPLICLSMYQRSQLEKVRQAELNTVTEQLQQTLDAAYLGITDWDIVTNVVSWSPHAERIFGLAEGTFEGTYESYLRLVYPEDLPSVQKAIEATLQGKDGSYIIEHRILWPNGQLHWIEGRGRVLYDDTGQPVRTMGTVMDITQQKQAEEALHNYNKRLQLLHLIDKGLLASESPQTIAQIVAENVQRLIGCEQVSISLFDFQTQQVTFLAVSSTIPTVGSKETPMSMEQYGLHILEANRRGEVYSTPDAFEDELRMRTKHQDAIDHIRAWLGAPMFYNGELIGSLNLGSLQPHFFTETQKEIAEEVANQLAIALSQARLSKETSEALRREQRLNAVAHTISNTLDLSALLPKIVQLSIDLMDADAGSMGLITPDEQALAHPYLLNLPEGIGLDALIPKGQGVAWRVISTKKGFMSNHYPADPDALPQWVRAGLRSYIEVPLIAGDSCLGVLGVFQLSQEKKFKPRDLALAESIGQQAGIAIQNARLFAATQRQLQELSVLRVMAEAGASATNEDALLEQIAKIVSQTLYPDIFGIGLWDETIQALRPHPASRGIPASLLGSTFRLGEGVVGWVAASHRPWRIPDTRREVKYLPLVPDILSEMAVPILAGERLIGILDVESKKQNAFILSTGTNCGFYFQKVKRFDKLGE